MSVHVSGNATLAGSLLTLLVRNRRELCFATFLIYCSTLFSTSASNSVYKRRGPRHAHEHARHGRSLFSSHFLSIYIFHCLFLSFAPPPPLQGFRCQSVSVRGGLRPAAPGHTRALGRHTAAVPLRAHTAASQRHAGSGCSAQPQVRVGARKQPLQSHVMCAVTHMV